MDIIADNGLMSYLSPSINRHIQESNQQSSSEGIESSELTILGEEESQHEDHPEGYSHFQKSQATQSKVMSVAGITYESPEKETFKQIFPENKKILKICSCQKDLSSVNYRKLLQLEIEKNKNLNAKLLKCERKCENLFELTDRLKEENKILAHMLDKSKVNVDKKNTKLKEIDEKIALYKNQCKSSGQRQEMLEKQAKRGRKQRRRLREENQKYRLFISALIQSVNMLNNRKVDGLPRLWEEWKLIFEEVSFARCVSKGKS